MWRLMSSVMSSTRAEKRYSPPRASILVRMPSTTVTRRKVPIWGLARGQDFLGGAGCDELGEQFAGQVAGILDAAVELAVGEGAGAALAELDVGLGVEDAAAPEAPGVAGALADELAAFEDERAEPHLGEGEGGHQATGAGADDDRARRGRRGVDGRAVARVLGGADARVVDGGFVAQLHVDGVDQVDRGAAAGVIAAAGDGQAEQVLGGMARRVSTRLAQGVGRVVEGEFQFGQTEHGQGLAQPSWRAKALSGVCPPRWKRPPPSSVPSRCLLQSGRPARRRDLARCKPVQPRRATMKLYFAPGACSIGIHLLLEEVGKPYETERVNLQQGEQYKPPFVEVNPKSKVPTLARDDGSVLTGVFRPSPTGWRRRFRPRTCCRATSTSRLGRWSYRLCRRHDPHAGVRAAVPLVQHHAECGGRGDGGRRAGGKSRRRALPCWTRRWRARTTRSARSRSQTRPFSTPSSGPSGSG